MNYHDLTREESKNSPQRRYQHIVICSVIALGFSYSVYISGVLLSIQPFETKFPGGTFCYKDFTRDYAASMGIGRRLQKDILAGFPETVSDDNDDEQKKALKARKKMIEDRVHHIYLDNPEDIGGNNQRFMTGVLASGGAERKSYCNPLFEKNPALARNKKLQAHEPVTEKGASALFDETVYKSVSLPSVDSVAIRFTYSDGFASALALSYKVRLYFTVCKFSHINHDICGIKMIWNIFIFHDMISNDDFFSLLRLSLNSESWPSKREQRTPSSFPNAASKRENASTTSPSPKESTFMMEDLLLNSI